MERVKALYPASDLGCFDGLIEELDRFEAIRYPDDYLQRGAQMMIGWGTIKPVPPALKPSTPLYRVSVNDVDALVAKLFVVCRLNPEFFFSGLSPEAWAFLEHRNEHAAAWLRNAYQR